MIEEGTHTEHGCFASSPLAALDQFEEAVRGKKLLDLGAGKGYVVEKFLSLGANAFGVEIEPELYNEAITKDRIFNKDMFDMDFSKYDVLYYYINGCKRQDELFKKIGREFKGYMIIYNG